MSTHRHRFRERRLPAPLTGMADTFEVFCAEEGCTVQAAAPSPAKAWLAIGGILQREQDDAIIEGLIHSLEKLAPGWAPSPEGIVVPHSALFCSCGQQATVTGRESTTAGYLGGPFSDPNTHIATCECGACGRKWTVRWRILVIAPAQMAEPLVVEDESVAVVH